MSLFGTLHRLTSKAVLCRCVHAVIRLVGAVLCDVHDDWQVADRRYLSEGSMALVTNPPTEEIDQTNSPELPAA